MTLYNSSSNEPPENLVRTFKNFLNNQNYIDIYKFKILAYDSTKYCATGVTPAVCRVIVT